MDQPSIPSMLPPNSSMNIIYPLVQTVVKGIQINVVLDEFAELSYATEKTVSNLKLAIRELPEKVVVEGFGGTLSDPIDKFAEITFKNGATIACNIVNEICDELPPVTNNIFRIWPELQQYKNELSAPVPRKAEAVNVLIGLKDMFTFMYTNYYEDELKVRTNPSFSMRLDPSFYGYIIKGGVGRPVDWDGKKQIRDIARVCREIPMDGLLERIFKTELDDHREPEDTKFNILGKRIFTENYKIKEKDGKRRFIV